VREGIEVVVVERQVWEGIEVAAVKRQAWEGIELVVVLAWDLEQA